MSKDFKGFKEATYPEVFQCVGDTLFLGPCRFIFDGDIENMGESGLLLLPTNNKDIDTAIEKAGDYVSKVHRIPRVNLPYVRIPEDEVEKGALTKRLFGLPIIIRYHRKPVIFNEATLEIEKEPKNSLYSGMWVNVELKACYAPSSNESSRLKNGLIYFLLAGFTKVCDDEPLSSDDFNSNAGKETQPTTFTAKNPRELTERNKLEKRLKDKGATKPQETVSSLRAYHDFREKGLYFTTRYYSRELCSELEKVFDEKPSYWNTITDKGLKYYFRSPKLISPSFMSGFAAWQQLHEKIDDHDVFDFFDLVNGKKLRKHPEFYELHRRLRESNAKFGLNINEDMQRAIYAAWEKYYCNN